MARDRRPPKARRDRAHGIRPLPESILVVTGGKFEKLVLDHLKQRYRNPTVHVEVRSKNGDPLMVVNQAAKLTGKPGSRRGRNNFDEVWVVFDCDEFASWNTAISMAEKNHFALAISNPCFELWALLTQTEQRSKLSTREAQRRFARFQPRYHHDHPQKLPLDRAFPDERIAAAHLRAERLRREAERPHENPSTTFHLLVARIEGARVRAG